MYRENEQGELVLDMEPSTNLPRFYDPVKASNRILNDLHQYGSLKDM